MDNQTVRQQILAARAKLQEYHEESMEIIPGLWGRFHPVDFAEGAAIVERHEKVRNTRDRQVLLGADLLLAACTGTEARVGDVVQEFPPLGIALNEALGLDVTNVENDRQAVIDLFPTMRSLMACAQQVEELEGAANQKVDTELAGNSEAVAR